MLQKRNMLDSPVSALLIGDKNLLPPVVVDDLIYRLDQHCYNSYLTKKVTNPLLQWTFCIFLEVSKCLNSSLACWRPLTARYSDIFVHFWQLNILTVFRGRQHAVWTIMNWSILTITWVGCKKVELNDSRNLHHSLNWK